VGVFVGVGLSVRTSFAFLSVLQKGNCDGGECRRGGRGGENFGVLVCEGVGNY
jgi:hypothetical protein